jgi:hypothetical protein
MDEALIDYALSRILDDERIGNWATGEVEKLLGHTNREDDDFWPVYTNAINDLLDAARKRNNPVL